MSPPIIFTLLEMVQLSECVYLSTKYFTWELVDLTMQVHNFYSKYLMMGVLKQFQINFTQ